MKTNAANNEKEMKALARKLTLAKYGQTITITVMLFSVLVIALLPAIFSVAFLLFTVPFLLLPAIFTAEMKMRGAPNRDVPNYKETFQIFGNYFFPPWRGVFRALRTVLLTALLWTFISSIAGVIYLRLASNIDPSFLMAYEALVADVNAAQTAEEVSQLMLNFSTSLEAANFEKFTLGFASGFAGLYFLHQVGISSFVAQFHFLFDGKAQYLDNRIFYGTYRTLKASITGTYWRFFYFMPIAYLIGFVPAYVLGAMLISNPLIAPVIGFAGVGLVYIFALPYYWNLLLVLGIMVDIPASDVIIGQGKATIEQMKVAPNVPKAVVEQTEETVRVLEETLNAKKEALKEKAEPNKSENDKDPEK